MTILASKNLSPIGSLRKLVNKHRSALGYSQGDFAEIAIEAHSRVDSAGATGITFERRKKENDSVAKKNAERIFRWLDDSKGKYTNLLSVNFLPSLLAALPIAVAVEWLNSVLRPLGLEVRRIPKAEDGDFRPVAAFKALNKEQAEACIALIQCHDNQLLAQYEKAEKCVSSLAETAGIIKQQLQGKIQAERALEKRS